MRRLVLVLLCLSPAAVRAEGVKTVSTRPGKTVFIEIRRPGPLRVEPPLEKGALEEAEGPGARVAVFRAGKTGSFAVYAGDVPVARVEVRGIGAREIAWLLGGLLLFLFGMHEASAALRKAAGGTLRMVLHKVAANRLVGVGIGVLLSVALQSSSAATVMLVGLAGGGLLGLEQAVPVVLGAALGTTVTVQVIAFNLSDYALYMVAAGALMVIASPYRQWAYAGRVMLGFGLLFLGMAFMKDGVSPLKAYPAVGGFLAGMSRYPVLGILAAAVVTGVIQSSAATIALGMTLASAGMLDFGGAASIVLGANIGTTATALISCIGTSRTAVRIAVVHFVYKVLGVIAALPLVWFLKGGADMFSAGGGVERAIANFHLAINLVWVVLALPFTGSLAALARKIVPGKGPAGGGLDRTLLDSPAYAVEEIKRETGRIAGMVRKQLEALLPALLEYSGVELERLEASDEEVDAAHRASIEFLRKLAVRGLGDKESYEVGALIYVLRDLEAIGDLVSKDVVRMGYKRLRKDKVLALGDLAALKRVTRKLAENVSVVERVLSKGHPGVPVTDPEARSSLEQITSAAADNEAEFLEMHAEHFRKLQHDVTEAVESDSLFVDFVSTLRQINYLVADAAATLLRPPGETGFFHPKERQS